MPRKEDRTFFLYSLGYPTEQLCLGHLSFGSYSQPTLDPRWHCSIGRLSETEIDQWAYTTEVHNCSFTTEPFITFEADFITLELLTLGLSCGRGESKAVTARRGRRVVLKDPEKFLSDKVLSLDHVNSSLQRWLHLAKYGLKDRIKRPKIWFLTGLYELEGVSSVVMDTKSRSVQAGIGPALMALLSLPQGGRAGFQHENTSVERVEIEKNSIWAAQYQLLDAKYILVKEKEIPPPHSVRLKPRAVFSRGTVRSDQAQNNFAELVLGTPDTLSKEEEDADAPEESWAQMAEAERIWEEAAQYLESSEED